MNNRILSILLAVVMIIITSTACAINSPSSTVSSTNSATTPNIQATTTTTQPDTAPTTVTEELPTEPDITIFDDPELNVEPLGLINAKNLSLLEICELSKKMVELSYNALSFADIYYMGYNFADLIEASIDEDGLTEEISEQLSANAYEAFCNIVEQAEYNQFPQKYIGAWSGIPSKDVLLECYKIVTDSEICLGCTPLLFGYLSESDAIDVASAFLNSNHTQNCAPCIINLILCDNYPKVQEMGIEALISLSKSSIDLPMSNQCSLFSFTAENNDLFTSLTNEKWCEIRDNILNNSHFDFVQKYTVYCNSAYVDVNQYAFGRLLEIANSNPDAETVKQLRLVANNLWSIRMTSELLEALYD